MSLADTSGDGARTFRRVSRPRNLRGVKTPPASPSRPLTTPIACRRSRRRNRRRVHELETGKLQKPSCGSVPLTLGWNISEVASLCEYTPDRPARHFLLWRPRIPRFGHKTGVIATQFLLELRAISVLTPSPRLRTGALIELARLGSIW